VDVFTDHAFGGNPLAVVLDAGGLSTAQMQAIASEFNYSETTFVLPPQNSVHDAQARIFHRERSVDFFISTAERLHVGNPAAALKQLTANRQDAVSRYPGLMSAIPRKRYLCEIGMREAGSLIPQSGDVLSFDCRYQKDPEHG
jgi:hypothetical protein